MGVVLSISFWWISSQNLIKTNCGKILNCVIETGFCILYIYGFNTLNVKTFQKVTLKGY